MNYIFTQNHFTDNWPFIVSLNWYSEDHQRYIHQCGGSIINKHQILSAAHCFRPPKNKIKDWIIIAGKTDIYNPELHGLGRNRDAVGLLPHVYLPKEIIKHGGYRHIGFVNDIAIVNLKRPLRFGGNINPIKLAFRPPKESENCSVAGWGAIDKDTSNPQAYPFRLHETKVPIRDFDKCRANYFLYKAKEYKISKLRQKELVNATDLFFWVQARQNICAGSGKTDSCAVSFS